MATSRAEIRFRDLDGYGHVNYSAYLDYLEKARSQTLGLRTLWDYVIVRLTIQYRSEVRYEDEAVVASCRLVEIGRSSVKTQEELRTAGGRLAVQAEGVFVAFDLESRTSHAIPDDVRAELEQRLEA
jgi:YbgC/YbaW family acyl-CoA thioester hydrolase